MSGSLELLRLDQPATYQIIVRGRLDGSRLDRFHAMHITIEKDTRGRIFTGLTGRVRDQSELHGVLARPRDLCLPLVRMRQKGIESVPIPRGLKASRDDTLHVSSRRVERP
jgi:hypothetical protein